VSRAPDTCDMVTARLVAAGDEVFNTYSDGKPMLNDHLLAEYGFVLAGNGSGSMSREQLDKLRRSVRVSKCALSSNDLLTISLRSQIRRKSASHSNISNKKSAAAILERHGGAERGRPSHPNFCRLAYIMHNRSASE